MKKTKEAVKDEELTEHELLEFVDFIHNRRSNWYRELNKDLDICWAIQNDIEFEQKLCRIIINKIKKEQGVKK